MCEVTAATRWPSAGRFFAIAATVIVLGALVMRLTALGNAGTYTFGEGVYWQTIRALHAGHRLYGEFFFSQPPLFALLIFGAYEIAGQSIGAARAGIALVSVLGIWAAGWIAHRMTGRGAALTALALMALSPFFLRMSQTLEGDAAAAALALVAVALACQWVETRGSWWAFGAGVALAAAILTKLLVVPAVVPIAVLWLQQRPPSRSTMAAFAGFAAASMAILLPFAGDFGSLIDQVVTFHLTAATIDISDVPARYPWPELIVLLALAMAGAVAALRLRCSRAWPIVAWVVAVVAFLAVHSPTWPQHFVSLVGPLVILASLVTSHRAGLVAVIVAGALGLSYQGLDLSKRWSQQDVSVAQREIVAAVQALPPEIEVLSDSPYLVALAGHDVPAAFADPSIVRIRSGYLTIEQLRSTTAGAVLILGDRLGPPEVWLPDDFRLVTTFRDEGRLWVRD